MDMLEIYLKRTNYENHFYLREKYFTDSISREDSPTEVVRKYLKEAGCPVNITKIYNY